jgi:penicillin-binding protein 1A
MPVFSRPSHWHLGQGPEVSLEGYDGRNLYSSKKGYDPSASGGARWGRFRRRGKWGIKRHSLNIGRCHLFPKFLSLRPGASAASINMLQAVVNEGTGKAARIPNVAVAARPRPTRSIARPGLSGSCRLCRSLGRKRRQLADQQGHRRGSSRQHLARLRRPRSSSRFEVGATGGQSEYGSSKPGRPVYSFEQHRRCSGGRQLRREPQGAADVSDTATLAIRGRKIQFEGVLGDGDRRAVRALARFLRRREVTCEPAGVPDRYRCNVDGQNLSAVILSNGGARAAPDAPAEPLAAEYLARSARVGIWRGL